MHRHAFLLTRHSGNWTLLNCVLQHMPNIFFESVLSPPNTSNSVASEYNINYSIYCSKFFFARSYLLALISPVLLPVFIPRFRCLSLDSPREIGRKKKWFYNFINLFEAQPRVFKHERVKLITLYKFSQKLYRLSLNDYLVSQDHSGFWFSFSFFICRLRRSRFLYRNVSFKTDPSFPLYLIYRFRKPCGIGSIRALYIFVT